MPARMGAAKPPMLLEAVQKPQKVPRSLSGYQRVKMRAHAGAPKPCRETCVGVGPQHVTFTGEIGREGIVFRVMHVGGNDSRLQQAVESPQRQQNGVRA